MPVDQPDRAPAAPLGEQVSAMRRVLAPIHPAGWPFIAIFAAATVGLGFVAQPLGWIGAVLTAWCVFFFRDPRRVVPTRPGLVVSAADGLVQGIVAAPPPPELGLDATPLTRVSVFLNVFDVHVNRVPADGVIEQVVYRPGKFFNASLDKASDDNERMAVSMRLADGRRLVFVQIAGLVARRIVCTLRPGQVVKAGERFGMIRFGSRTDLYLPAGAAPLVAVGQRMVGGESVIADLASDEPARSAEAR